MSNRKSTTVSMTLAAMATVLTVGATTVYAANGGLSTKQVRKIVRQEVARIPQGPIGPAGPAGVTGPAGAMGPTGAQGPAGMDGIPFLFTHVSGGGTVDDLGGGITQANLASIDVEPGDEPGVTEEWEYCFTGLPPLSGGQVTIDGGKDAVAAITLDTGNPNCSPLVQLGGQRIGSTDAQPGFHVLLY